MVVIVIAAESKIESIIFQGIVLNLANYSDVNPSSNQVVAMVVAEVEEKNTTKKLFF